VDDEPNIVELLAASLRFAGFEVTTATDGLDAVRRARALRPDAILMDVMMPGVDGFAALQKMRAAGIDAPVLFLTARDALADRVNGLTIGADDYITKPFSLEAVLRRSGAARAAVPTVLQYADIVLDEDSHEVFKAGRPVELSPTEFNLLRYFLANPGRVLSKAQILDHVWHYDFGGDANVVESYVSYLRRKIDTTEPRLLQTVRGVGYVLRLPRGS
jgi:two-component system OmpR family response regulator